MSQIIKVEFFFNTQTNKLLFSKLDDQKCLSLIASDNMIDVWAKINNIDCLDKIEIAKYVGNCHKKGLSFDKLILNMAEECYRSMSDAEQLLFQKSLELWANRSNKVFTWSLYETPIYFIAKKICFYIYQVSGFVEEIQDIASKIDDYSFEIDRLWAKDKNRVTGFNNYLQWIINN